MPLAPLDNLVKIGQLKAEPPAQAELHGLIRSGEVRLADAHTAGLRVESRFDLAYNAAHALALAALRWHGYRPDQKRFIVFQTLPHTLNLDPAQWRVLEEAHRRRNLVGYEGVADIDEELVAAYFASPERSRAAVRKLGPV